jgi:hypothetical protein
MGFIPWPSQDIEDSLDEFFTNRLTLRLMISHIQALNANKNVNSDGEARHDEPGFRLQENFSMGIS